MSTENLIYKVVVGSRLHGLNDENSDYDYRGIFMVPVIDILSPFRKQQNTSWIEDKSGGEDNTSFELTNFCKMAVSGNATILEILWSGIVIKSSAIADYMRDNRHRFLARERVYRAGLGYAENQVKKMDYFNPGIRTNKCIVAYIRTLRQTTELLSRGSFNPIYDYPDRNLIMEIKYNFKPNMLPIVTNVMTEARKDLENAYKTSTLPEEADVKWIENFIYESYIDDEKN